MICKVGIYGDPHAGYDGSQGGVPSAQVAESIVARFSADQRLFDVICLGDAIHNQAEDPWIEHSRIVSGLADERRIYALGNHDVGGDNGIPGWRLATMSGGNSRVRSVPGASFLMLDIPSNELPLWAIAEVIDFASSVPPGTFAFICWHAPYYTTGMRGRAKALFELVQEIAVLRIDAVFSAHVHAYERYEGAGKTPYIVTGGGGGMPHELDANEDTPAMLPIRRAAYASYNYVTATITRTADVLRCVIECFDALTGAKVDELALDRSQYLKPGSGTTKLDPDME